jgi:hypothetical protein
MNFMSKTMKFPRVKWLSGITREHMALTREEQDTIFKKILTEITKGKRELEMNDQKRELIYCMGPPGAGKSTIYEYYIKKKGLYPLDTYVIFDPDTFVKYHPRKNDIWGMKDIHGKKTKVGVSTLWDTYMDYMDNLIKEVHDYLHGETRFNLVEAGFTSDPRRVMSNKIFYNMETTLLFVGVILKTAVERAAKRSIETGFFLGHTLERQKEIIEYSWECEAVYMPIFAMLTDRFIIVNNNGYFTTNKQLYAHLEKNLLILDPHNVSLGATLTEKLTKIRKLIEYVTHYNFAEQGTIA